jgi:hypothetical protein
MECIEAFVISTFSSLLVTILVTIIWVFVFRPSLKIEDLSWNESDKINVKIRNTNCLFSAINLKVEICTIRDNDKTRHFSVEKEDFLILPKKDTRVFRTKDKPTNIDEIKNNSVNVRVRFYAEHSFTGFGKAFENEYKYVSLFEKIK